MEPSLCPQAPKITININIAPPADANADKLPIYSGFITVRASCERYTIPYVGFITTDDVLDRSNAFYPSTVTNPPAAELGLRLVSHDHEHAHLRAQ